MKLFVLTYVSKIFDLAIAITMPQFAGQQKCFLWCGNLDQLQTNFIQI